MRERENTANCERGGGISASRRLTISDGRLAEEGGKRECMKDGARESERGCHRQTTDRHIKSDTQGVRERERERSELSVKGGGGGRQERTGDDPPDLGSLVCLADGGAGGRERRRDFPESSASAACCLET